MVVLQSGRMSFAPRTMVGVLIAVVAILGTPGYAADPGSVAGQALSAVGEPLEGATVELLKAVAGRPTGSVLQTVTSASDGAWQFIRVVPGDYVVQMTISEQLIAVPVSLAAEAGVAGVQLVAPSVATAAGAAGGAAAAGAAGGAGAGGGAAAGAGGTAAGAGGAAAGAGGAAAGAGGAAAGAGGAAAGAGGAAAGGAAAGGAAAGAAAGTSVAVGTAVAGAAAATTAVVVANDAS